MWDYRARVDRVVDGDTVDATLDLGFNINVHVSLRLLDTFAPEHDQPGGPETAAFVKAWLAKYPGEWPLTVTTSRIKSDAHEQMSFDRYVALVTVGFDSLNADVESFVKANGYGGGIGS